MDRQVSGGRPWKLYAVLIGAFLVLITYLVLKNEFGSQNRSLKVSASKVSIAEVSLGQFKDTVPLRANVDPAKTVFLDVSYGGRVDKVLVQNGESLNKGDLLIKMSNPQLLLDVISREAQIIEQINDLAALKLSVSQNQLAHRRSLEDLDYELIRLETLIGNRAKLRPESVSREEVALLRKQLSYNLSLKKLALDAQRQDARLQDTQLVQIESSTRQLEKNLDLAKENLKNLDVRATVDGQLTSFDLQVGQSISPGERIGQIDSTDNYKLSAQLDEFFLSRLEVGQRASGLIDGQNFSFEVSQILPEVINGRFRIELTFLDELPQNIRRGQTIQALLTLAEEARILTVATGPFLKDSGGSYAFVLTKENVAERRTIELGRKSSGQVQILSGLNPGDRIIVSTYETYESFNKIELK